VARKDGLTHVGDALSQFFQRAGMKRSLKRAEAVLLWPRVAGPEVARFSSARSVQGGVLYVDVDDSETAMHLSLQRRRFLAVYHDTYRATDVKEIRFQAGRAARRGADAEHAASFGADAGPDVEAPAPEPRELTRLARELGELDLSEDVSALLLNAGRSLLSLRAKQRAAGYAECPTCGALHPGPLEEPTPREEALVGRDASGYELPDRELCAACRRYAHQPSVKSAALRLRLDPTESTPLLSDAERAVAVRLAHAALDGDLQQAFVEALGSSAARPRLAALARIKAALASGRPPAEVREADLAVLDPRYRRFLDLEVDTGSEEDRD